MMLPEEKAELAGTFFAVSGLAVCDHVFFLAEREGGAVGLLLVE